MTRKTATSIENNFIQGLITEKTALTFPENACIDTDNCVFYPKGNVTRRSGIDAENTTGFLTDKTDTQYYQTYLWEAASGSGNVTFLVLQAGRYLYFFDQSNSTIILDNKKSFFVDLEAQRAIASTIVPGGYPCSFASGNGDLFVVNHACDPFYVTYDQATDDITVSTIIIKFRDFDGYDDGIGLTDRPTESVASLKTNNPKHYYNIINQGWHATDALTQWDTALTTMPSNADQVGLYRASETDAFDATKVTSKSPGNTPAPKGHFILEAANPDRVSTATAEGFSFTLTATDVAISQSNGSVYTDFTARSTNAFDGDSNQTLANSAIKSSSSNFSGGFIGKTYPVPVAISRVAVSGSNSNGYVNTGAATSITIQLYGQNGSTLTLLGTTTFNQIAVNESAPRTIVSTNTVSTFEKVYINVIKPLSTNSITVSEVTFYTPTGASVAPTNRHTAVAFLGGRVFYSGLQTSGETNKVWFSQVITTKDQYGKCYQKNDPTAEDFFELLSDDGGVVKILELGYVVKLFPLRSSLVVFASNGVWLISSSNGFKATDYNIKKLSGIGTTSPNSIVDVKGMPLWWAEDGIYTMQYDPNYDSFQVVNLTLTTIKSYITNIPQLNRKYVVGAFDSRNDTVMWMYNDSVNLLPSQYNTYNKVLCLNVLSKAFYPWTINPAINKLRSICYVQTALRSQQPKIKFITTVEASLTQEFLFGAEPKDDTWSDWGAFASFYANPLYEVDYTSYVLTGYKIHGDTQRFTQPGYMFVFLNTQDDSSCYMHVRYDYTNDSAEGKWSSVQQVYNPALTNRNINYRRLKVRGKGRAMQIKFESETGKPFDIIGWSMRESSNGDI